PRAPPHWLAGIYGRLSPPGRSRSISRNNTHPFDIWRGMLLNTDGRAHEAYVEREALLGYEPAIAIVRRCAENSDDPQARQRAAFILAKMSERVHAESAGDGEVRPHRPPAKKAGKDPATK